MNAEQQAAWDMAWESALYSQRECSWCGLICKSSEHLVIHISLRHPKAEDGSRD